MRRGPQGRTRQAAQSARPVAPSIAEFRPVDTPRPPADDALYGRSPGSRVTGFVPPSRRTDPDQGPNNSGIMEPSLAAYSCGGSQGIGRAFRVEKLVLTLFPLASFGHDKGSRLRNHQAGRTIGMAAGVSNGGTHEGADKAPSGHCIAQSRRKWEINRIGRSERIRTSDPVVPNDVRYQAAPHSASIRGAL